MDKWQERFNEVSDMLDKAHREINPCFPFEPAEIHHRCFYCSAYFDECQCDRGLP